MVQITDNLDTKENMSTSSNLSIPEQIKKLSEGLEVIQAELHTQIKLQYPNLLKTAAHSGKLNVAVETLGTHMAILHEHLERLKKQIYVPYNMLDTQIKILERLNVTAHILRNINRFLFLHSNLTKTTQLEEQARILYDMESLIDDEDLNKIDLIVEEKVEVLSVKKRILHIANRDLNSGLQNANEAAIKQSLQIYTNLNILDTYLDQNIKDSYINDIAQSIKLCFQGSDVATLQKTSIKAPATTLKTQNQKTAGPGKIPQLSTSMHFKTKLLVALEWLITDELFSYFEQILLLQKCMNKVTPNCMIGSKKNDFLSKFTSALSDLLENSFKESQPHVLQNLQQHLPKILSAFNILKLKLNNEVKISKSIFSCLESGYIEKCGSNLKVSLVTSEHINEDIITTMVKNAFAELNVALIDADLCAAVVEVLCICNKDFWSKIRSNIKFGTDSQQVVGSSNQAQVQNIVQCNLIYFHQTSIEQMMLNLDLHNKNRVAFEKLATNLTEGRAVTIAVLQQLMISMESTLGIILLSIHREPGLNSNNISITTPSMYMKELQDFLNRAWTSLIIPFTDKPSVNQCAKELAIRCIELFVQNVAILRPVSLKGRQRLQCDCNQLEVNLQLMVSDLSSLGKSYRTLRSLSQLIILPPEDLVKSAEENTIIAPYIWCLLLFGYGDNDLVSPHIAAGWSNEKLIVWLSDHTSERERLELISGALQKYRTVIRKKNLATYDPVYPLLSTYLEKTVADI